MSGSRSYHFTGTEEANTLFVDDGNFEINGLGGDDYISSGTGRDTLDGGEGRDSLLGGSNDDLLRGGSGDDILVGEAGSDTLSGGSGNDRFFAFTTNVPHNFPTSAGIDNITGGDGSDIFDLNGYSLHGASDFAIIRDFKPNADRIVFGTPARVSITENVAYIFDATSSGAEIVAAIAHGGDLTVQDLGLNVV